MWQELSGSAREGKKYVKYLEWHGTIVVGGGRESVEERVQAFYKEYKKAFAEAEAREETLSRETIQRLQKWMGDELREIYASLEKPKKLDMVVLAKKLGIEVGSPDWDKKIVEAVKQDKHLGETK